jgi:hypothetical protein
MTPDEKPKFVTMFAKIWSGIYSKEISTNTLDLYWKILESCSLSAIERALFKHLRDAERGRFLPLPSDLMHQINGSSPFLSAWTKVSKAIQIHGTYQTVVFDDPIIHCVIHEMGGWIQLCEQEVSKLPFYQKEFERRYQYYFRHPPNNHPKSLMGKADQYNQQIGFSLSLPCFYGDKQQSHQVYESGIDTSELMRRTSGVLSLQQLTKSPNLSSTRLPSTKQEHSTNNSHDNKSENKISSLQNQ